MGFSIIPLKEKSKKPAVSWEKYQERKPTDEEVNNWLKQGLFGGIGIVTGDVSGNLVVIDIDEADLLNKISIDKEKICKDGWLVKTGRGWHLYLKNAKKTKVLMKKSELHIEYRGGNGYVVAPPSVHPSGQTYEFIGINSVDELPELKPVDVDTIWQELKDKVAEAKGIKSTTRPNETKDIGVPSCIKKILEGVKEGSRDDVAFAYASFLKQRGLPYNAAVATLEEWNKKNQPPLPKKQIDDKVKSAFTSDKETGCQWWQNHGLCDDPSKCPYSATVEKREEERRSQRDNLMMLAEENCIFFHNEYDQSFAAIKYDNGSVAVYPVRSKHFKNYLSYLMYTQKGVAPNSETLLSTLNTLEAKALFDGEEYELGVRVTKSNNCIYYDLAGKDWQIIKITPDGWKVVIHDKPLFRRYSHMLSQVFPTKGGGDFKHFLRYANLKNKNEGILLLVAIASYMIPSIPHPVLGLYGEAGSAKTTLFTLIRKIVDPSALNVSSPPDDKKEFVQNLSHHYVLPLDNVSSLHGWQSDLICRAVTGDGISKRELYSDDDDIIYRYRRCIMLNGISVPFQKADIMDRAILLELKPIPEENRREENEIFTEFEQDLPSIFAGVLTAISKAMKRVSQVRKDMKHKPRMADFCVWGEAISRALGYGENEFYHAYIEHIRQMDVVAIEESSIGEILLKIMEERNMWEGTPTELYTEFEEAAEQLKVNTKGKYFPKAANALSRRLNNIMPNLRRIGINVEKDRGGKQGTRKIIITKVENKKNTVSIVIPSLIGEGPSDGNVAANDIIASEGKDIVSEPQSVAGGTDGSDAILGNSISASGYDRLLNKIMIAMSKHPTRKWFIGELTDATGIPAAKIKEILWEVTQSTSDPTPIRMADERGDVYVLDKKKHGRER